MFVASCWPFVLQVWRLVAIWFFWERTCCLVVSVWLVILHRFVGGQNSLPTTEESNVLE